jgi:hypothetical protein
MGIRITDLASASTVGLTDTLVFVQAGNTKKCEVSQVKTLNASELVSGTLGVARLPVVPVSLGGTGSVDATSAVAALGAQPALTSSAPASIVQGGTGATTAVAALDALGGITSAVVPSLVTAQLSAYTLLTQSAAYQNSEQVLALASGQIAAITPASIGAVSTSAVIAIEKGGTGSTDAASALSALGGITSASLSAYATTAQIQGIAVTSQLSAFQNSAQVQALTTSQLNAISITAGAGLVGGGALSSSSIIALETTGVSAGTFGTATSVAQFTVNDKGQITSATNVGISGTAGGTVVAVGASSSTLAISNSPITFSGALQLELSTTGVPAITAGSSTQSAVITVDAYGRVTALETQAIQSLSPSGVVSGSYGHPERVAQFTVDTNGIITGATEVLIAISAASVSGLAASATSDTTNAGNIITGTLSSARISVLASSQISGISAAQVGTGITSAQIVGIGAAQVSSGIASAQITGLSASQVGPGITSAQVDTLPVAKISGLATSATTDTTNATNITTGTLAAARVGTGITSAQITGLSAAQVGTGITSAQINTLPVAKISGLATSATTDTTNASNITTGTLAAARVGTGITSAQVTGISVTQVGSLGTGVSTFLQTPSSANLAAALTDETGTGANVFATSPTIATPTINGYTEGTVAQGTVGATATLAITSGTVITATLTSATPCTFTMPAVGAGKSFALYLKQPASGTPTTATFTGVKWASGIAPTITATLGRLDILSFVSDGVNWYGSFTQNFTY